MINRGGRSKTVKLDMNLLDVLAYHIKTNETAYCGLAPINQSITDVALSVKHSYLTCNSFLSSKRIVIT